MPGQIESRSDVIGTKGGDARYWEIEFQAAEQEEKKYREQIKTLEKKYRAEDDSAFNIFYSNVETLKPVLYSKVPKPNVAPKLKSVKDPLSRQTSIMLETALDYSCGEYDLDDVLTSSRDDRLIGGRGIAWVVYKSETEEIEERQDSYNPVTGVVDVVINKREEITEQELYTIYIHNDDYRQSPAKKWCDVRWVARRHTPTRDQAIEQFGDIARDIPLGYRVLDEQTSQTNDYGNSDVFKRAEIWEIWDKDTKKRHWFVKGFPKLLDSEDDPYLLEHFFPMPKPLLGVVTNSTMIPVPDYNEYCKQVHVVEDTTKRINDLTLQLQVKGMYTAVSDKIVDLINLKSSDFVPVLNIDPTINLSDQIVFWPIEKIAEVIVALYQARDQAIQVIYQITGLSDIVRGASDPNETATAQQIKGNFANTRLNNVQKPMQVFIRDILRIKAELIAEHFTPEKLAEMTNMPLESQVDPETGQPIQIGVMDMVMLLRNEKLRKYRIDIETDSMVEADADADKQRRIEFMTSVTEMINQLAPLVSAGFMPEEVAKQLLMFGSRGFKVGRELEDALENIGSQKQQQPEPPSEAELKAQTDEKKLQLDMKKHEDEMQLKTASLQQESEFKQYEAQNMMAAKQAEFEFNKELEVIKLKNQFDLEQMKMEGQFALEKYKADLNAQVKHDVEMNRSVLHV